MFAQNRNLLRVAIIGLVFSSLIAGLPALGQDDWTPPSVISMENSYVGVAIGRYGKWKLPNPPYDHTLIGEQPVGGRFQVYTTGGDPTTAQDDNQLLNYGPWYAPEVAPGDKWGAFQLMVDSTLTDAEEGAEPFAWATFTRGGTSAIMGDLKDGNWSVMPYRPTNKTNVISGVWYPTVENGQGIDGSTGGVVQVPIRCDMEVRLLRDTIRFKWTVTNEDSIEHLVGIRQYADVMPNPVDDGTIDMRNVVSIPGHPIIENRTVLLDKGVPAAVEMFNAQENPETSIRFILKGQGATTPDVIGIDEWTAVSGSDWTYWFGNPTGGGDTRVVWDCWPTPNQAIVDLGYGAFWKPRRVAPNGSVTYIAYMGLACATSDLTKPNMESQQYVAAVQGPRVLRYTNDNAQGIGQVFPSPFTIHAWMTNNEKYMDFNDASFSLTLPTGLTLDDSENGKYSKSVAKIAANGEAHVSWKVKPVGNPTGILDYTVSMSAAPVGGTTVRRQINIPATEYQNLQRGWQMISVPFALTDPDPMTALGVTNGTLWRYDSYSRQYKSVTKFEPGQAYWLKLNSAQSTLMTTGNYSPREWAGTQGHQIPLVAGWNLIGNPYVYTFTLGEIKFYYREFGTMTYDEAVTRGLISSTVFWWDPTFRQYSWSSDRSVQIKPWQGYWLRALRSDVLMIATPSAQIGAAVGGQPIQENDGDDGENPPPAP